MCGSVCLVYVCVREREKHYDRQSGRQPTKATNTKKRLLVLYKYLAICFTFISYSYMYIAMDF